MELQLPLTKTENYGIIMGNGIAPRELVSKAMVNHQPNLTIKDDFLPMDLGNIDMILGRQWLRKRGFTG